MPSAELIAQWLAGGLGVLGGGKFVWDVLTVRSANHKTRAEGNKTSAEGAVILVDSASNYAKGLVAELRELRAEFDRYRREQDGRWRRHEALARAHGRWDDAVADRLADLGEAVDPPPPLFDEQDMTAA